ncbi:3-hydroxyacyl-CoA dehydrogenase NAD-binding domain-containing protein [Castellaniella sp.]|uniref:3-hydroxyacyl-CoA dehydrogenase NAD-binding domain-containing protein n=1 Tax=Castellaniella sp. TaxID=1955812 RepID=UPI00355F4C12
MHASEQSPDPVTWHAEGAILVATLNNPPVNALNAAVRSGLLAAVDAAEVRPDIQALLLVGAGKNFIAGADIQEFGRPARPPALPDVCLRIESCSKLVVAAIEGVALGGGLEVAMAAHYRIAHEGARLGLPEVNLGLLPGAGGTQRAPRLIGAPAALELILSGKPMLARQALAAGLVDRLSTAGDMRQAGIDYAQALLEAAAPLRRTRTLTVQTPPEETRQALASASAQLAGKFRGLHSPARIIDAIRASAELPFEAGAKKERAYFLECLETPQRKALVHAFFAERKAARLPGLKDVAPRRIEHVGVIGGGTMGSGITVALLSAGLAVTLIEQDSDSLARGHARVRDILGAQVSRQRLTGEKRDELLRRLETATTYEALAEVDLVIEAVYEDMGAKQAVFAALDAVCRPGAILASNTSYLDLDQLAASVSRPGDVVGLHFFSPAHVMKLLEVVVPSGTAADVVATAFALARRLGKTPVRAGVCDGFIGNRILRACRQAADYLLADGASPYEIDGAVYRFGYPMGPFRMSDLAGGDIGWATRKRLAASRDPQLRYVPIADRLCENGWFGQKTGRGWYRYAEGNRTGSEDPDVLAIVEQERRKAGWPARTYSEQDIMRRYLAAMVNESAHILSEGIALRPLDIDVVLLLGYGFPRWRGGPMHYADQTGVARILADVQACAADDPAFWKPAPLLVDLAQRGGTFAELNETPLNPTPSQKTH